MSQVFRANFRKILLDNARILNKIICCGPFKQVRFKRCEIFVYRIKFIILWIFFTCRFLPPSHLNSPRFISWKCWNKQIPSARTKFCNNLIYFLCPLLSGPKEHCFHCPLVSLNAKQWNVGTAIGWPLAIGAEKETNWFWRVECVLLATASVRPIP